MDGMDHSVNPSVIATPCIGCNFCTMICPTGALDDSAWLGLFAAGHHNLESMKADLLPRLAQAEADGAFRRLVPWRRSVRHPSVRDPLRPPHVDYRKRPELSCCVFVQAWSSRWELST